jgi:hypothetical protein
MLKEAVPTWSCGNIPAFSWGNSGKSFKTWERKTSRLARIQTGHLTKPYLLIKFSLFSLCTRDRNVIRVGARLSHIRIYVLATMALLHSQSRNFCAVKRLLLSRVGKIFLLKIRIVWEMHHQRHRKMNGHTAAFIITMMLNSKTCY